MQAQKRNSYQYILDRIGNTPLIELKSIVQDDCSRILVKVESENPTGSMKDRMALAMIEAAERDGRLKPGGHVVEYTAGSTGVSLALVCAAKGYSLSIVTSDAFSIEKRNHMAVFGADLTIVRSAGGAMDADLTHRMIEAARVITERKRAFWTDQLNNEDQIAAYHRMGDEIWNQTAGRVGAGFVVPLWKADAIDEIATVSTEEAMDVARRLVRTEALFAGTSTGANVTAAIELGRRLGPDATIVTVMCDSGVKYLSTALYRDGLKAAREWSGSA